MRAIFRFALILCALPCLVGQAPADEPVHFLAFQIFTRSADDSAARAFPPPAQIRATVFALRDKIGATGANGRQLGFILGPISLDNTDDETRALIATGFDVALETGLAVGFHLDDSMFWRRSQQLHNPATLEWLDWKGTLNTGRRLDWSATPLKIEPQLCFNSPIVERVVEERAALIGQEIVRGLGRLHAAGKDNLFVGVISGWETQIGRDFDTGKHLGYCALTNAGYSAADPPADIDAARVQVVNEFIGLWSRSLHNAGLPEGKIYSHIAYMSSAVYEFARHQNPTAITASWLETINFSPPSTAFCDSCIPGLSTYPQPNHLEQWRDELKKHGDPPWASCEGTALDPGRATDPGNSFGMEGYLGNLFNHGAVLVNIFGWAVGDSRNPFRKQAESASALAAYRKFLDGGQMQETPLVAIPPPQLIDKIHEVQTLLPPWVDRHGPARVKQDLDALEKAMKQNRFEDADTAATALLMTVRQ
jgi:hypothetical protein